MITLTYNNLPKNSCLIQISYNCETTILQWREGEAINTACLHVMVQAENICTILANFLDTFPLNVSLDKHQNSQGQPFASPSLH